MEEFRWTMTAAPFAMVTTWDRVMTSLANVAGMCVASLVAFQGATISSTTTRPVDSLAKMEQAF